MSIIDLLDESVFETASFELKQRIDSAYGAYTREIGYFNMRQEEREELHAFGAKLYKEMLPVVVKRKQKELAQKLLDFK